MTITADVERVAAKPFETPLLRQATLIFDRRTVPNPEVSFIVPVYNEVEHVSALLDRLTSIPLEKEIILVDDGSKDGTRDLLKSYAGQNVGLWFHKQNEGKGSAVRTALSLCRGQYAAIQDADLEYDPFQYLDLLQTLKNSRVDVVYGSRFLKKNPRIYYRFFLANKLMTFVLNLFCRSKMTDSYTCYKLMDLNHWIKLQLNSNGFELEAEISVKVAMRHYSFKEVAIDYAPRRLDQGKKIGWRDAVKGLGAIIRHWQQEKSLYK